MERPTDRPKLTQFTHKFYRTAGVMSVKSTLTYYTRHPYIRYVTFINKHRHRFYEQWKRIIPKSPYSDHVFVQTSSDMEDVHGISQTVCNSTFNHTTHSVWVSEPTKLEWVLTLHTHSKCIFRDATCHSQTNSSSRSHPHQTQQIDTYIYFPYSFLLVAVCPYEQRQIEGKK